MSEAVPQIDVTGPELILNLDSEEEVATGATPVAPDDLDPLLEEERGMAEAFFARLKIQDSFVARLVIKLPEMMQDLGVEVAEKAVSSADEIRKKIKVLEEPPSKLDQLPLSDLTADTALMKRARVSFDQESSTWMAVWKKPAVFHFGMILHPELLNQVSEGEKLHFESKGMALALVRSADNKLMVEQSDGQQHELSAKRLEGLLKRSINVDGLELFLDPGGNLVLKADGEKAVALAHRLGNS